MIPAEATNIDYVEPAPFAPASYASFDITETGYRAWVDGWRERFPELPLPRPCKECLLVTYDPIADKPAHRTVLRALVSHHQIEDWGLTLTYDLDHKRAYFHPSTR